MRKNQNTFVAGDYNAICDRCGWKYKASDLKKEWTGLRVCGKCWEPRHPMDFIKTPADPQSVPWTRPEAPDTYVTTVSLGALNPSGGGGTGTSLASTNTNYLYVTSNYASDAYETYQRFNTTTLTYETAFFVRDAGIYDFVRAGT